MDIFYPLFPELPPRTHNLGLIGSDSDMLAYSRIMSFIKGKSFP